MVYENMIPLSTTPVRPFDPVVLGFNPVEVQVEILGVAGKYWKGGKSPTDAIGFTLPQGGTLIFTNADQISQFRIVATTGSGFLVLYARG